MAHFAELDKDNKVLRVVSVDDSHVSADMATDGETWCANNIAEDPSIAYVDGSYPGVSWKQTSHSHSLRKRFAGPECVFIDDGGDGCFTTPKPFANWVLNSSDGAYYPPVATPSVTTYTEGSDTFEYVIEWDQDNTRFIATKVGGSENPYYRHKINTANAEVSETISLSDPASTLTTTLVWNLDSSSWS